MRKRPRSTTAPTPIRFELCVSALCVALVGLSMAPSARALPTVDADADGILDSADLCPSDPEDRDGFQDSDGCPDPDNDADGIRDVNDMCPNEPETLNGRNDADGCPD